MRRLGLSLALLPSIYASGASAGFDIMQFVPLLLIFVIFYFLILRPQQKKARSHQEMVKALRKGDKVLTAGGIIGSVDKVISDTEVSVEIADGVKVRVLRNTITDLVAKTQPVAEKAMPVIEAEKEKQPESVNTAKKSAPKAKDPAKAVATKKPTPKKK